MLQPLPIHRSESVYDCPATEFELSVLQTGGGQKYRSGVKRSVEILLCTDGKGQINVEDSDESVLVKKGDSFLIPACLPVYEIKGSTTIYKASVPLPMEK
jgi:mannose-6-phosphate isomerase